MPFITKEIIIEAGATLSSSADCSNGLYAILIPDDWTSATLQFEISYDDDDFHNYCTHDGKDLISAVTPGSAINIGADFAHAIPFMRLRASTAQENTRTFVLVLGEPPATIEPMPARR